MRPVIEIEACREGHVRLLNSVAALTEGELRAASLLPGYSRAHVIAHIANKAWAHVVLLGGAAAGEVRRLHPEGYDSDEAAREGACRPGDELRSELERSLAALEAAWDHLDEGRWDVRGVMMAGSRTMAEIVGHHLRNVEVHHVDLDVGYRPADWPRTFVDGELARRLRALPDRAEHPELLAWLLGRGPCPALAPW
ncbi:MAG: maleylpyruvate isomerase family mycothiol-dependent enzyme [Actinobacteria bacterium]|nr:maleylpyruvate isomerase family mycothiol-dependent enzyme [Actinomycetota bacterium]